MGIVNINASRQELALACWEVQCKEKFEQSYPAIDFFAPLWPLRKLYKTICDNFNVERSLRPLISLDDTYRRVSRCLAAEIAIENLKVTYRGAQALKLLSLTGPKSIFDLGFSELLDVEKLFVEQAVKNPISSSTVLADLNRLVFIVDRLRRLGVVELAAWDITPQNKRLLMKVYRGRQVEFRKEKAKILDRQIEALADATSAMLSNDVRLTRYDRVAIAILNIMMCAPARINEPLCMSIDDFCSIEDYTEKNEGQISVRDINRVHMLLLQKGSKGGAWGAKPVLNFMIGLLNRCINIILEEGRRSRLLVQWYEKNPGKLYLPDHLEYLRGKTLDRVDLWRVMYLLDNAPPEYGRASITGITKPIFADMRKRGEKIIQIKNPRSFSADGKPNPRSFVQAVAWEDAERVLLQRVHERMESIRNVSVRVAYEGKLSRMLVLVDGVETPYLPAAVKYGALSSRFKQTDSFRKNADKAPTIFANLGLLMVVNGVVQHAYIETHDPRRWLTTQAMLAKERLSDVLINKWANRVSLRQVESYDLRSDIQKADQATMPSTVLLDFSAGLERMSRIEAALDDKPDLLVVNDANIAFTSIDAIVSAQEDRPVAKTANQLIILYPTPYGVCTHQHHETPCAAYHQCAPCDSAITVKGHLPTNEAIKIRYQAVLKSIVAQLGKLVTAHNRGIADSVDGLESHILTLVRTGLGAEQLADNLIDSFYEVKSRIKSVALKNKLEEAFAERGIVRYLDSQAIASGALIKFHNPERNGSPALDRYIDSVGGRKLVDQRIKIFCSKHPEFSITELGVIASRVVDSGGMDGGSHDADD
jgi:hypothetical protein